MATGYVNIKGRGLKFCQGSISQLQRKIASLYGEAPKEMTEDEKSEIDKKVSGIIESYGGYWLAHYGLEANCIIKGQDIDFTFEETVEWMESLTGEEILQIKAAYDETQEYVKNIPEKTKKKNQQKQKKTTGMSV